MPMMVFPAAVRDQVRAQHNELRGLLSKAATLANDTSGPAESDLVGAARALHLQFRAHLAFEDEALKPVLAVLDSWGPERVRNMHEEHVRQRRRVDDLIAMCEAGNGSTELAVALGALARDLLDDMADEESGCLGTVAMSSECLMIEHLDPPPPSRHR